MEHRVDELISVVKELGGRATNKALQAKLGWDKGIYLTVRSEALQQSLIALMRGRGGGVRLPEEVDLEKAIKVLHIERGVIC